MKEKVLRNKLKKIEDKNFYIQNKKISGKKNLLKFLNQKKIKEKKLPGTRRLLRRGRAPRLPGAGPAAPPRRTGPPRLPAAGAVAPPRRAASAQPAPPPRAPAARHGALEGEEEG